MLCELSPDTGDQDSYRLAWPSALQPRLLDHPCLERAFHLPLPATVSSSNNLHESAQPSERHPTRSCCRPYLLPCCSSRSENFKRSSLSPSFRNGFFTPS